MELIVFGGLASAAMLVVGLIIWAFGLVIGLCIIATISLVLLVVYAIFLRRVNKADDSENMQNVHNDIGHTRSAVIDADFEGFDDLIRINEPHHPH